MSRMLVVFVLDAAIAILTIMAGLSLSIMLIGLAVLLTAARYAIALKRNKTQYEATQMNTQEVVVKKSTFQSQVNAIVYVTVITFLAAIAVTVFTGTPRFGFYVVSMGSIYVCYQIAAITFMALLGLVGVKRVYDHRKVQTQQEVLDEFEATTQTTTTTHTAK